MVTVEFVINALSGDRTVDGASPHGDNLTEVVLYGTDYQIGGGVLFMPSLVEGAAAPERSSAASYLIERLGGKIAEITPNLIASRRSYGQHG